MKNGRVKIYRVGVDCVWGRGDGAGYRCGGWGEVAVCSGGAGGRYTFSNS